MHSKKKLQSLSYQVKLGLQSPNTKQDNKSSQARGRLISGHTVRGPSPMVRPTDYLQEWINQWSHNQRAITNVVTQSERAITKWSGQQTTCKNGLICGNRVRGPSPMVRPTDYLQEWVDQWSHSQRGPSPMVRPTDYLQEWVDQWSHSQRGPSPMVRPIDYLQEWVDQWSHSQRAITNSEADTLTCKSRLTSLQATCKNGLICGNRVRGPSPMVRPTDYLQEWVDQWSHSQRGPSPMVRPIDYLQEWVDQWSHSQRAITNSEADTLTCKSRLTSCLTIKELSPMIRPSGYLPE
ncbi:hypothetical protein J6590_086787 [Homalodisca vitripennis]|nr:hypothetical protein J6590_086787 [Homalodisca vitripennis]